MDETVLRPPYGHRYGRIVADGQAQLHLGDTVIYENVENGQAAQRVAIRRALYYESMNSRKVQLESQSFTSFDWVWDSALGSWIQCEDDNGIFWLSGKPGSGKSTLMHYLVESDELVKQLPDRQSAWTVVQFYFDFRAGTGIANNPTGMLRSLLLQLVQSVRSIDEYVRNKIDPDFEGDWRERDTILLTMVCESIINTNANVCVFIDGLDEYSGSLKDLLMRIIDLQHRTHVKIIVASRPETVIQRMLAQCPTLLMQEHNSATIEAYIQSALTILQDNEFSALTNLWNSVLTQAQGVILWARFVIDELVEYRMSGATTRELMDVLHTYPPDLRNVYDRILGRLSPTQRLHAAIALHMLSEQNELPVDDFFVAWTVLVEKYDCEFKGDVNFGTKQFLLRMQAILRGLIDISHATDEERFGVLTCRLNADIIPDSKDNEPYLVQCMEGCTARLVHKTLRTYVGHASEAMHEFEKIVSSQRMQPLCVEADTLIIANASRGLGQDPGDLARAVRGAAGRSRIHEIAAYCVRDLALYSAWKYRISYLLRAILRYPTTVADADETAEDVWAIFTTSVLRLHGELQIRSWNSHLGYRSDTWQFHYLANHRMWRAFQYGWFQQKLALDKEAVEDLIWCLIDIQSPEKNAEDYAAASEILDLLLEDETLECRHVAIYLLFPFPEKPRFIERTLATKPDYSMSVVEKCAWWRISDCNLLCCWAWASLDDSEEGSLHTARLQCLFDLGLNVNGKAYSGGTVMHALFEPHGSRRSAALKMVKGYRTQWDELWPLDEVKFRMIRDAGYDFAIQGEYGSMLGHARKLLTSHVYSHNIDVDFSDRSDNNSFTKSRVQDRLMRFIQEEIEPLFFGTYGGTYLSNRVNKVL